MTFAIFCTLWYILGVIGCIFGTLSMLAEGQDFTVSDLLASFLAALFGPVALVVGFSVFVSVNSNKLNKTLIKARK